MQIPDLSSTKAGISSQEIIYSFTEEKIPPIGDDPINFGGVHFSPDNNSSWKM